MYVPFSKQINQNDKEYIMISFQNKTNDLQTEKFLDDLKFWSLLFVIESIFCFCDNLFHPPFQHNL